MNKCKHNRIRCKDCRESKSVFYKRWWHIRARCTFKWDKDYKRYGGSGISFDWDTYQDFKKDMYESYLEHVKLHGEKQTTIERIDYKKSYSKDNCRWATTKEQSRNRSNSRLLTVNGITMNICDWAEKIGCSRQALRWRLENGVSPEIAISKPFSYSNRFKA